MKIIKSVIKTASNMVMVFDARGEQIPEYQGDYQNVRDGILKMAPPGAIFAHWQDHALQPVTVPREDW